MKITLATSFFPPTHSAGTEKRTFGYAKTLKERGHQVQVVCAGKWSEGSHYWNGYTDEIYQGISVRRLNFNWKKSPDPNSYLYRNPLIQDLFQEWLNAWKPDIVHITSCITLSASIIESAKELNLPVILTLTDFWFVCHKLSLLRYDGSLCDGRTTSQECIRCLFDNGGVFLNLKQFLSERTTTELLTGISKNPAINRFRGFRGMAIDIDQRKYYLTMMLDLADAVTAPSQHLRDTLYESGITQPIQVIQSGHDLSWLDPDLQSTVREQIRFGYIGQITPTKGIHTLVSAFGTGNFSNRTELHLYGDYKKNPEYFEQLQRADSSNGSAIIYHGPFPHKELGKVLSEIDVLIVPSLWHENNPRVIQEAFASKTPVIASNVGGISEYVQHEVNGLLFQRGDVEDLIIQISRVVDQPDLVEKLRSQIPRVKRISDEIDEIENIYYNITSMTEVYKA